MRKKLVESKIGFYLALMYWVALISAVVFFGIGLFSDIEIFLWASSFSFVISIFCAAILQIIAWLKSKSNP